MLNVNLCKSSLVSLLYIRYNQIQCVPQGSVPGLILFNIYLIPLLHHISNSPIIFHNYTDDIQI